MKVALNTWYHYQNYGTVLQAYALYKTVQQQGHKVDIVQRDISGKVRNQQTGSLYKHFLEKVKNKIEYEHKIINSENKKQKFIEFLNDELTFTDKCNHRADLENLNNSYDAFIAGSDQIWSPLNFDPHFFLDYVGSSKVKISYAPSMGVAELENLDIRREMASLISGFDFLSVREARAKELIGELGPFSPQITVDPTLLLEREDWAKVSRPCSSVPKGEYALIYLLGNSKKHLSESLRIAQAKGLVPLIIPIHKSDIELGVSVSDAIGPREFLYLMNHSSYVCTDSYHGVLFSIIFRKKFSTFYRFKSKAHNNQNSRVQYILEKTNLEDRLVVPEHPFNDGAINWDVVVSNIQPMKEDSLSFLSEALSYSKAEVKKKDHIFKDRHLCCGCGACAAVCPTGAISKVINKEGFYNASVDDDKCISCRVCRSVCPFLNSKKTINLKTASVFAFKSDNAKVLSTSSSGGAAAEILKISKDRGYINAVGCLFSQTQMRAKHELINLDSPAIEKFKGSKYVQSDFFEIPQIIKGQKKPSVIFGTPCQIAGLRNVLGNRKEHLLVEIICHGVPSHYLLESYLSYLEDVDGFSGNDLNVIFRYKPAGWRRKHIKIESESKELLRSDKKDPFYQLFMSASCNGIHCYECPWRKVSAADIRVGDFWGPKFRKDKEGVSIILGITEFGREIVGDMTNYGKLMHGDSSDYFQNQQTSNTVVPTYRKRLIHMLQRGDISLSELASEFANPFLQQQRVYRLFNVLRRIVRI